MPLKKKKYNARFPAGRIKKIMQSDEDVGKVAQAVPIIISRTLELFVESMLTKTLRITNARNAKTLSPSHMKQCIMSESRFDFLRELVKNIPDINVAEEQQCDHLLCNPERRESSEDGVLSIDSPISVNSNGINPNGSSVPWKLSQRNQDAESYASGSSSHSHWKITKLHSVDSFTNKNPNHYSIDDNKPINYSIKIKVDDKPPPAKLLRMESTPASFGTAHSLASPITITPNYLPSPSIKSADKQPVLSFDFSKLPLPSTTMQITTPTNHFVHNILKTNDTSAIDTNKNEIQSLGKTIQRSSTAKSQPAKTITASSTIISTATSSQTSATPLSIIGASSNLEMDEDYDNI